MKVWLVNPFDPLPGEQEQLGRYAHLADALRRKRRRRVKTNRPRSRPRC